MFKKHILIYLITILILTSALLAISISLYNFYGHKICLKNIFSLIALFFFTNIFLHFLLVHIFQKKPSEFVSIYLLSSGLKLIIYMTFIILYIFNFNSGIKCFLLSFLILYFAYALFEAAMISAYLKNNPT